MIRYETGQRRLDVFELRLICAAIGIGMGEFVSRLEARLGPPKRGRKWRPS